MEHSVEELEMVIAGMDGDQLKREYSQAVAALKMSNDDFTSAHERQCHERLSNWKLMLHDELFIRAVIEAQYQEMELEGEWE